MTLLVSLANASLLAILGAMSTLTSIAEARRAAGLTQQRLAEQMHVSRGAVAQWEMENGTRPDPANAVLLTQLLPGLTLEVIYGQAA